MFIDCCHFLTKVNMLFAQVHYISNVTNSKNYFVCKEHVSYGKYVCVRTYNGRGQINCADATVMVEQNSILFLLNDDIRTYKTVGDTWDFWWVEFDIIGNMEFQLNSPFYATITQNELKIYSECLSQLRTNIKKLIQKTYADFTSLLYLYEQEKQFFKNSTLDQVRNTVDFIHKNFTRDISISSLAQMCKISERRYRDLFTSITNVSPKKYINIQRINLAYELLKTTQMSVEKISQLCGFSNQFYFSKEIKYHFGLTPTKLRKDR